MFRRRGSRLFGWESRPLYCGDQLWIATEYWAFGFRFTWVRPA